jgi:hypothetical protein
LTGFDRLFQGVAIERPGWLKNGAQGREHITRQNTPDHRYARVLEGLPADEEDDGELLERATAEEYERPRRAPAPYVVRGRVA